MRSIKEKQLLVKWAKAMNEPVDDALVEEVERYEHTFNKVIESVKQNSLNDLAIAAKKKPIITKVEIEYPKPPTLEEVLEAVKEIPEETKKEATLVELAADHIHKEVKVEEQSYQQPDPPLVNKELADVVKKLKYLEQWIGKISLAGPGGGAGDVINLDHPVKLITGDYTITRKDYYIGVNAIGTVNITLLSSIGFPGRKVIIKDESGNCSNNPIVVNGTVDNDPGGFILQQDNGGIQMIYREGWRII